MARTPAGEAITEAHRQAQVRLIAATLRDLALLWEPVNPADIRGTLDPATRAFMLVASAARRESVERAVRYYATFREVEGVPGAVSVLPAPVPDPDSTRGLFFGAAARGIMNARSRGADMPTAKQNGFVKLSGSVVRLVAGGARDTLLGAVEQDPEAVGYQRVTDANPCAFCRMVASRGVVAHTKESAGFKSHGLCGCTAEPAFKGSNITPRNAQFRAEWEDATKGLSGADALRAYRNSLAHTNMPATG